MRNGAILALLLVLTGCASTQEVISTVPDAIGATVASQVFGGEVSYPYDPEQYIRDDVNRTSRRVYTGAQLSTKESISSAIMAIFDKTK